VRAAVCVALAALVGAAWPARAAGIAETYFAGGRGCYIRSYDAAHLKAHPRQTVARFRLSQDGKPPETPAAGQFGLDLALKIAGDSDDYGGLAICTPAGDGASCYVEGDQGEFTLAPRGDGLAVTVTRMSIEGGRGFSRPLEKGDNSPIHLAPAPPDACR
jgi:hypothetical protein